MSLNEKAVSITLPDGTVKRIKHRPSKEPQSMATYELHISNGRTLHFEDILRWVEEGAVLNVPNPHWLADKVFPDKDVALLKIDFDKC